MHEEVGHIRMRSDGTALNTQVEMWNGNDWVKLRGVVAASYEVASASMGELAGLGYLKLTLWPQGIELDVPQDQLEMRTAPTEMETNG